MKPGWTSVALGDVCEVTMGQAPAGDSYNSDGQGVPLVAGAGDFDGTGLAPAKCTTKPTRLSQEGDIVVSIRASIGARVRADGEYCLGRGVAGLRPKEPLDVRFLWHWIDHAAPTLVAKGRGATFLQVNRKDIVELELPLPPLDEQNRIAAILDKVDDLLAKRRAAIAHLDSLTQAIFLDMFGDPGTNPRGIRRAALGTVLHVKSGASLTASQMTPGGRYPVYGGNGVAGQHDQYLLEDPVIVIGRVGVYCGCVHVSPPRSWVTDNALYVTRHDAALRHVYLFHVLMLSNLNRYASQAAQPLISGSRIYPVEIPIPPVGEQVEFERKASAAASLRSAVDESAASLSHLRAALQSRAFKGEL